MTKKEYQRLRRFINDAETHMCTAEINFKIKDQEYELRRDSSTHNRVLRIHKDPHNGGYYTEDIFSTLMALVANWNHTKMIRYSYIDCAPDVCKNIRGRPYHVKDTTSIIYF